MRVLLVGPDASGSDARTEREAAALRTAGHDVVPVRLDAGRRSWPARPLARVAERGAIVRAIRRVGPDAVHVIGPVMPVLLPWLVRMIGATIVYESPEGSSGRPAGRLAAYRRLRGERRLGRRAALLVARSPASARGLARRLRQTNLPVVVLDVPDDPGPVSPANLRGRLGIMSRLLLVHVGAQPPSRAKTALLRALADVPVVHVAFLGADAWDDLEAVRLLAERTRVSARVHFLREVPEDRRLRYMAEADAVLVINDLAADHRETLPPDALAAISIGRPLVSIAMPEVRAFLPDANPSMHADAVDPGSIAAALRAAADAAPNAPAAGAVRWQSEIDKLVHAYLRLPELTSAALGAQNGRGSPGARMRRLLAAVRDVFDRQTMRRPSAAFLHARGRLLRAGGRFQHAADLLVAAATRDPSQLPYAVHAAGALRDAGRTPAAISAYRELFERVGQRPDSTAAAAAVALAQLGARRDAEAILRVFRDAGDKSPATWVRIAEIEAALGHLDAAREAAAKVEDPGSPGLSRVLVRVLEQSGDISAARDAARAARLDDAERRLSGNLTTFDPTWRPAARRPADLIVAAVRDGEQPVLNLLETSLPHVSAGYAHRSSTVVAAQARAGYRPTVATRLGFPANRRLTGFAPVETVGGVPHHRFVLPGVHRYSAVPLDRLVETNVELATRLAAGIGATVVQAATPHVNCLTGLGVRRNLGIPLVYDVRGFPEMTWAVRRGGDQSEIYRRRRDAETQCMVDADLVTTLSDVMRSHIVERGVDPGRVAVLPHAVDIDALSPGEPSEALISRYALEGKAVVGCVSSLLEYEGIDTVLRALPAIRASRADVSVLIVGDGPARRGLEQLAAELRIADAVVFAGRVAHAEIADHYRLLDLFVVPRRDLEVCRYVAPLKPFEAMSAGVPLICSDLPVLSEIIGGGARGATFTPGDPAALADRISGLLDDPAGRLAARERARDFVVEHHSLEALERAVASALGTVTGTAPPTASRSPEAGVTGRSG